MSIYDLTIPEDLEDIYEDDDGFWCEHDVNGKVIKAIVHAAQLTPRTAIIDLGTYGADIVCIVRKKDYGDVLPQIDSVFFLDGIEHRVSGSSRLGGLCFRIGLRDVSS